MLSMSMLLIFSAESKEYTRFLPATFLSYSKCLLPLEVLLLLYLGCLFLANFIEASLDDSVPNSHKTVDSLVKLIWLVDVLPFS